MKKEEALLFFYRKVFFAKENWFWKAFFEKEQKQKGIWWIPKREEEISFLQEEKKEEPVLKKIKTDDNQNPIWKWEKQQQEIKQQKEKQQKEKQQKEKQQQEIKQQKEKQQQTIFITQRQQQQNKALWTEKNKNVLYQTKKIWIDDRKQNQEIQKSSLYEKQRREQHEAKENQILENTAIEQQKILLQEKEILERNTKINFWQWNENRIKEEKKRFLEGNDIQEILQTQKYHFFDTIHEKQKWYENMENTKNIYLQNQGVWEPYDALENIWQKEKQMIQTEQLQGQSHYETKKQHDIQKKYDGYILDTTKQNRAVPLQETKIDMDTLLYDMTEKLLEQRQRSRKMHGGKI